MPNTENTLSLTQLTEESIHANVTLLDYQKETILQVLSLAQQLGLTIWQPQTDPCYYIARDNQIWLILDHDEYLSHPLKTLGRFLEFMLDMQPIPLQRLETLEQKVAALEKATPTLQEAKPTDGSSEQLAAELDTLALEPPQKTLLSNLRARAKRIGCDILWTDKLPTSAVVQGDNRDKQFNCVYIRPVYVPDVAKGRTVKLSTGLAHRPRWPHWKNSADQTSEWLFHLPKDFRMLEDFIIRDEFRCGIKQGET